MILGAHAIITREIIRIDGSRTLGILLMKRDYMTGKFPGYWACPGGCVDDKESPLAAIKREIIEELGFSPIIDKNRTIQVRIFGTFHHVIFFVAQGTVNIHLSSPEGLGLAWFNPEELNHIHICPEHRVAINKFLGEEK